MQYRSQAKFVEPSPTNAGLAPIDSRLKKALPRGNRHQMLRRTIPGFAALGASKRQ
jgi:hypothetical protein